MPIAQGTFNVDLSPVSSQGEAGASLGHMTINKVFAGDLIGSSKGNMLSAMTTVQGSADYVAIEQFVGALGEKSGSFILTHHGRMYGEISELNLSVVPDSGTGDLKGLSGTMTIDRTESGHAWTFTYEL